MDENLESMSRAILPDAAIASDELLLGELQQWIGEGLIVVEDNSDPYFALIESTYPIGVNRIDWRHVKDARFHSVLPLEMRRTISRSGVLHWSIQKDSCWAGSLSTRLATKIA